MLNSSSLDIFLRFLAGVFRVFRVGDFEAFMFAALAELAGAFNTAFLIPGFAMAIFLVPALADFMDGFFRVFMAGDFRAFMAGDFRVFRVGDFGAFRFAAFEALAEVAGAFNTAFLIPGFAMAIFLAPALADFLEAAEFGAAMVLTSCLLAGQWDNERDFIEMDKISLKSNIVFVLNFPVVFSTCLKYIYENQQRHNFPKMTTL